MKTLVALLLLAGKPTGPKVVIYPLQSSGVSADLASVATSLIPSEVQRVQPAAQVTSPDDLKTVLAQQNQDKMMGCTGDAACLAELGGAVGAREVVTGRIGRLGRMLVLELRRLDMRNQRTVASSARTVMAEEGLVEAVRLAVGELYGVAAPATSAVASAPLRIDKAEATYDPIQQATPTQPSDSSPDYDAAENGNLDFNQIDFRATKARAPCELARKVLLEQGLSIEAGRSSEDEHFCRIVTKWRSVDLGRRFRVEVVVSKTVDGVFFQHRHERCTDLGCAQDGPTERSATFLKSTYRSLFDAFESIRFK